jgi:competence protein ComEC
MALPWLQTPFVTLLARIEDRLEQERDQLPLWLPVALGSGIAAWFALPVRAHWISFMLFALAMAVFGAGIGWRTRLGRAMALGGLLAACGCGLIWLKSDRAGHAVLDRPQVAEIEARIISVEQQSARERSRILIKANSPQWPAVMRITVRDSDAPVGLIPGAQVQLKARIMPPQGPMLPGGYDFSRAAWFKEIGAVGQALGKVTVTRPGPPQSTLRKRLTEHVRGQLPGSAGGIAAAFATGDRGGIALDDEETMRASGLTHLLSISGLHVTAVVGATIFLLLRVLALSPRLALNWPLLPISAAGGALAGIGYTLLTGAEVPTIRSCVAAVLVLIGLALGREAMTLRLVATGALFILFIWPESLAGASFQLSFAAITSIVAFHESRWTKALLHAREEGRFAKAARAITGLLLTGLVVEVTLAPIALYHFHKSGVYGALANMIAIPLTTFVIMPMEALALLLDSAGLGAPFWAVTGWGLEALLALARQVAAWPGAVTALPTMPVMAFGAIVLGGIWLMIWHGRWRWLGLFLILPGLILSAMLPLPDLLITSDGRHIGLRADSGGFAMLRERTGDYAASQLTERAGETDAPFLLDDMPGARCSPDLCVARIERAGRIWRIAATRSRHLIEWAEMARLCAALDVVVSDRTLPKGCTPRWLKLDAPALRATGGVAINLAGAPSLETSAIAGDDHPWAKRPAPPVKR